MADTQYDVKILALKRWNSPQTKSLFSVRTDATPLKANCPGAFVSFQSYHFVDIIDVSNNTIPESYDHISTLRKNPKKESLCKEIHTVQNITMLGRANKFWDNPATHLNITFIQLSNTQKWDFADVEKKIKGVMDAYTQGHSDAQNLRWCVYYSLDFSDIILFTKNISFEHYHNILWELSQYRSELKLIRDSFTLFCFNYNNLMGNFEKISQGIEPVWNDSVSLSIQLSVQSLDQLNLFKTRLDDCGITYNSHRLAGRYDFNITTNKLPGKNVLKILYYLDELSNAPENLVFPNYEITFLVAPPQQQISGNNAPANHKLMNTSSALLKELCIEYSKSENLHASYAEETRRALLRLLKRGFSDEFVISILPSFISYLQMCVEIDSTASKDKAENFFIRFSKFKHRYFGAVNTLANCTMHTDRQFIQAPSYNATYFDIPPKLLAFYTAIADRISSELRAEEEEPYHFIIIPDYREDIYVKTLEVDNAKNAGQHLAVVYLCEKYFYDPVTAIQLLAHEIGHFVGKRNREFRAKQIFRSISVHLLLHTPLIKQEDTVEQALPQTSVIRILADSLGDYMETVFKEELVQKNEDSWTLAHIKQFMYKYNWGILFFQDSSHFSKLRKKLESYLREQVGSNKIVQANYFNGLSGIQATLHTEYFTKHLESDDGYTVFVGTIAQYIRDLPNTLYAEDPIQNTGYNGFEEYMKNVIFAYGEALADLRMIETCGNVLNVTKYDSLLRKIGREENVQRALRHDAICATLAENSLWARSVTPKSCGLEDKAIQMIASPLTTTDHIAEYLKKCHSDNLTLDSVEKALCVFESEDTYAQAMLIQNEIADYRDRLCLFCAKEYEKVTGKQYAEACSVCSNTNCTKHPLRLTQ